MRERLCAFPPSRAVCPIQKITIRNIILDFYKMMQMRPLQPSFMMRSMVSWSLMRASAGIRLSLLCRPSFTSS